MIDRYYELGPRIDRLRRYAGVYYAGGGAWPRWTEQHFAELAALEQQHADTITAAIEVEAAKRRLDLRERRLEGLPITGADAAAIAADTHERTRPVLAAERWLSGDVSLLALSGPPGRGKTVAASAALATVGGEYRRAPDVARLFLASFGDEVEERQRLIAAGGLVVVDDIGCELRADLMGMALVELVDARRRGQRTIIATNLSRSDFEQRYPDPRLHSRLAQSALWISDTGADLRRGR